jgi:preprotein translocase subunit SecB
MTEAVNNTAAQPEFQIQRIYVKDVSFEAQLFSRKNGSQK